ncbi:MAG: DNA repair protein RecO [Clostridiales bacterium]|nr:DNA repair protein RecO [Clostridiales bacterium]
MKTVKARGVVLREYEAGESDKRLILLCKGLGKLNVYARGARKPKSKFMAAAQLFTYGDYVLSDGGSFQALAQAEIIENFFTIREDYESLSCAHYIAEICEKSVLESNPADDLLLLLLKSLSLLNKKNDRIPAKQIRLVFLFRFFAWYGIAPETESCSVCGGQVQPAGEMPEGENARIPFADEGICCPKCGGKKTRKTFLSPAGLEALRHILNAGLPESFQFKASGRVTAELSAGGKLFWESHFQTKLRSEEFL